jgi:ribosomal protein S18 acetylase RimI-like enzyme
MTLSVHQATSDDVSETALLFDQYRVFYQQASDPLLAEKFIRERIENNESIIFVVKNSAEKSGFASEVGNELVGFAQLYPSFSSVSAKKTWVLNDLFVIPEMRSKGVGKSLLQQAENFAKSTHAKGIGLQTAMTNVAAQNLYESLGYEKDTHFFSYFLEL